MPSSFTWQSTFCSSSRTCQLQFCLSCFSFHFSSYEAQGDIRRTFLSVCSVCVCVCVYELWGVFSAFVNASSWSSVSFVTSILLTPVVVVSFFFLLCLWCAG
ncbi:hypothetical protein ABB37_08833 [Leptomonas pyrrhocoris]|uniref:Transmembrane protein n=1 Tax=Leptomonas pyrrhocoris TaxID=157538 RepID=A0A0N1J4C3_LEPPY|nr:hypothetical protein ABB37_08833 [Leptomonas pyrrhocoris]KPA75171.1 hypothetical protein ABB37_08833 [Leptomonas pyrrhocoris]|eukprot:XP_015653610.1 hypothetical protein ABB37_08833 [Leptomonas pyrrhocoris]